MDENVVILEAPISSNMNTEGAIRRIFILIDTAKLNSAKAVLHRPSCILNIDAYKGSIATQSLNSRKTYIEWTLFDKHKKMSTYGGIHSAFM